MHRKLPEDVAALRRVDKSVQRCPKVENYIAKEQHNPKQFVLGCMRKMQVRRGRYNTKVSSISGPVEIRAIFGCG